MCWGKLSLTRKEELAAVTVPYGLTKAGLSLPICSREEGRMPLSLVTVSFPGDEKTVFKPAKSAMHRDRHVWSAGERIITKLGLNQDTFILQVLSK